MRALVVLLPLLAVPAQAGDIDPETAVAYRQASFGALAKHMKTTGMIAKGQVPHTGDLETHAVALNMLAKQLPGWFPEGTGPEASEKTAALPAAWSDREGLEKAAKALEDASAKLIELSKQETIDLTAVKAQVGQVGRSCGGCHDTFKKDDDH